MTERVVESTSITGQTTFAHGSTSFMKYMDTGSDKWCRVSGSGGAPYSVVVGPDGVPNKIISGKIRTSSTPYYVDIAEGHVTDHTRVGVFGHNPDVGTALETVSDLGGLMPYLPSGSLLQITSDSELDHYTGSGAHILHLTGLDINYESITDDIQMSGSVAVPGIVEFYRIHQCSVTTVGAGGVNAGAIHVNGIGGSIEYRHIEEGMGYSHGANYTVPSGSSFYLTNFNATEASTKGSQILIFVRPFGLSWLAIRAFTLLDSVISINIPIPYPISAKTDIEVRAKAILAGANVTAGVEGWVET